MYSFPQIDPETTGRVTHIPIPLDSYLSASFESGQHDSAFNSIVRMKELSADNADNSPMLDPAEANKRFGVGDLVFDRPVKESAAQTMNERKRAEMDRNFFLANGASRSRFLPGIAASVLGGVLNPLDFALMFVPFVGEERLAARVAEAGGGAVAQALARGLITEESIAHLGIPAPKLMGAMINGAANQSLFEVPALVAAAQDHADYTINNALMNIGAGGMLAGAIHSVSHLFGRLSNATREVMAKQAMEQFLKDEDVRVHDFVKIDEAAIRDRVRFDEDAVRKEAIASISDDDLKAAIFQKFHEHPTQAAIMLSDGTVHTGAFHGDAYGKLDKVTLDKVADGSMSATEGFVTDSGRFVSRDEAAQMMGMKEHLTSEAMHGSSDESFLSVQEHDFFQQALEAGVTRSQAWNATMKYRYQNQLRYFFDRPDIHEKLNAERQRQVDEFIEKKRAEHDPQAEFTREVQAEIARQQAQGRILPPEVIQKHITDANFTEASTTQVDADVQNLRKNLENGNESNATKGEKEKLSVDEQKIIDLLPKPQEKSINAAVDCMIKKVV